MLLMASTAVRGNKWKKRRLALAKAEKMRSAKRAALDALALTSPVPERASPCSLPVTLLPSSQPGPSGLQADISLASVDKSDGCDLLDED